MVCFDMRDKSVCMAAASPMLDESLYKCSRPLASHNHFLATLKPSLCRSLKILYRALWYLELESIQKGWVKRVNVIIGPWRGASHKP